MKVDNRNSKPELEDEKLAFFYSILTLWESGEENKVVKNFKSSEIKRFLDRRTNNGNKILFFTCDPNRIKKNEDAVYTLYVKDTKRNRGLSLLYHLRNAFAHNYINWIESDGMIIIDYKWQDDLKLKTKIPFSILKNLIETIWGKHNLPPEEKKKKTNNNQKKK